MLLIITQWIAQDIRAFNVFSYITLRTMLAALTALVISFIVGPVMIRKLTAYKIGQSVRMTDRKPIWSAGTPKLWEGRDNLIAATALLWRISIIGILTVLLTTLGFGLIGWVDDYRSYSPQSQRSFRVCQIFLAIYHCMLCAWYLVSTAELPEQPI